jgi:predicted SnoaL-like aldol condensation-catalyzing enzyme
VLGQGDLVFVAAKGSFDGDFRAFVDIYRLGNEKLAEHWRLIDQLPPPGERKNDNGML